MKRVRPFLSLLLCLMSLSAAHADVRTADNSREMDDDGFSLQFNDPRETRLPSYLIEMKDGQLMPSKLVVPANTKFRLVVRNIGSKPAEFESNQLRQEKVLFMGAEANLVITPLDPGSYDYFDEFAANANGLIIAKPRN